MERRIKSKRKAAEKVIDIRENDKRESLMRFTEREASDGRPSVPSRQILQFGFSFGEIFENLENSIASLIYRVVKINKIC